MANSYSLSMGIEDLAIKGSGDMEANDLPDSNPISQGNTTGDCETGTDGESVNSGSIQPTGNNISKGDGVQHAKIVSYSSVKDEALNMTGGNSVLEKGLQSQSNKGDCDQADGNPDHDILTLLCSGNIRGRFQEVYEPLKLMALQDLSFEHCPVSLQWVEQMFDYNVPGGKMSRGLSVVETYILLKPAEEELSENNFFLACVLGWCIQWLLASALMSDDVVDNSYTRRGRSCWFRKVGMVALNDCTLLASYSSRILKNHFRNKPYHIDLIELFSEVGIQTTYGQMLDLMTTTEEEKDLSKFTLELQRRISCYKTAYGTFYLPVACALLMWGEKLDGYTDVKEILLEIGIYFQIQDDYLDCFGDPEEIGKIGTDIQEFKCSWMVVKALELCNDEQKKMLHDNYGKGDPANVAIVKSLYNDLNLMDVFAEYEVEMHRKLVDRIETLPSKSLQSVLKSQLDKTYHRKK